MARTKKYAQPKSTPRSPKASGMVSETISIPPIAANMQTRLRFPSGSMLSVSQP
jgi:hypothetical protein